MGNANNANLFAGFFLLPPPAGILEDLAFVLEGALPISPSESDAVVESRISLLEQTGYYDISIATELNKQIQTYSSELPNGWPRLVCADRDGTERDLGKDVLYG